MSAFLLTPRPFLRHLVAPSDRSPLIGPAPAQSRGAEVVPQVFSYLHPSSVGIRLCKCRSWLTMTLVKIQASNTSRNPLEPMRLEVMANSESVENCRRIEKPQKEAGTDSAMAGRAYADQKTGDCEARRASKARKVAVIGAGAAGLVAARELEREGHQVVVYERSDRVGGVWNYSPEVEDDPLGIRHNRSRVHCSMYESLRTNLPREVMGFLDFPFLPKEGRDPRRFPGHEEVYLYLHDFAEEFGILQRVRFNTEVQSVSLKEQSEEVLRNMDRVAADSTGSETHCCHLPMDGSDGAAFDLPEQLARPNFDGLAQLRRRGVSAEERGEAVKISSSQWVVVSRKKSVANGSRDKSGTDVLKEDVFDAVVVCNGHYSEPKIASIPGIEHWSGTLMHSHNYRVPTPFRGQVVVLIGCAASGEDISRELATVAQEVHICARSWSSTLDLSQPDSMQGNLWRHPMISCISQEGAVIFEDGSEVVADTIMHCTGYKYSFPFLERQRWISVEDNRVGPLFQHVFPPALAPRLSFVGLPYKVVPFPLCQLQSKWIAKILSGQLSLPSSEQMMTAVHNFYSLLEAHKYPKHYTHNMDLYQYAYSDWLSAQCGYEVQKWREEMYAAGRDSKRSNPTTYRDVWIDQQLMETVYSNLVKFQIKSLDAPAHRCHDNVHVVT